MQSSGKDQRNEKNEKNEMTTLLDIANMLVQHTGAAPEQASASDLAKISDDELFEQVARTVHEIKKTESRRSSLEGPIPVTGDCVLALPFLAEDSEKCPSARDIVSKLAELGVRKTAQRLREFKTYSVSRRIQRKKTRATVSKRTAKRAPPKKISKPTASTKETMHDASETSEILAKVSPCKGGSTRSGKSYLTPLPEKKEAKLSSAKISEERLVETTELLCEGGRTRSGCLYTKSS
jgi:hypothetical protein